MTRVRHLPAGLLSLFLLLLPLEALAEVPVDCSALGAAITEHSCFHSEFGPFTTVMATPGSTATVKTADVSPVHTEYRVGLSGEYSLVTYTPRRTGTWAVLLGDEIPVQVLAGKAEVSEPILDQAGDTGCRALPVLHVFRFTAETTYRLVFGPTAARTAVVVLEYIDDFLTENGRDDDGDGFGSHQELVVTPCKPPKGFAPNTGDCNDSDALVNPGAPEVCDGVDQNCNGVADDVGLACRAGVGACQVEGTTQCPTDGLAASCSELPTTGTEETCNGIDDDCNGKIDDAPDLCADPDRPTCVRARMTAICGCQLDLDCGAETSGRVCNVAKGVCEDGCSVAPGHNRCSEDQVCSSSASRCEPANAGGSGGAKTVETPGGTAAQAEGGEASEAGALNGAASEGCGCRVANTGNSSNFLPLILSLLAWRSRRRQWRVPRGAAVVLCAASLCACGGRVQEATPSSGGAATGTGGLASAIGGQVALPAPGGAAGSSEDTCEPALGEPLIEHACSHATNGPFVDLAAGGGIATPDMSDLHHTYQIQVVGVGAHLRYRAQRSGAHAFMTDTAATFIATVHGTPLAARPSFGVEGCAALTRGTVYELEAEHEYDIEIVESAPRLELFVEHLGAFGEGAWQEACDER
jgi:MYXO-CTERM domain-containing protein